MPRYLYPHRDNRSIDGDENVKTSTRKLCFRDILFFPAIAIAGLILILLFPISFLIFFYGVCFAGAGWTQDLMFPVYGLLAMLVAAYLFRLAVEGLSSLWKKLGKRLDQIFSA